MDYCTGLENQSVARHREFESHPLRKIMSEAKYILCEGERFEREGGRGNWFPRGGGSEALEPHGFKAQRSEQ